MPVTMQQVLAEIDRDEPDYSALQMLGPEALPHLEMLLDTDNPLRAAKAAYAATLIGGADAAGVLQSAAAHSDPQVRIAVAHGLRNAGDAAPTDVVAKLLDDSDPGVRKLAVRTAGDLARPELLAKVQAIADDDPHEFLRDAATTIVQKF